MLLRGPGIKRISYTVSGRRPWNESVMQTSLLALVTVMIQILASLTPCTAAQDGQAQPVAEPAGKRRSAVVPQEWLARQKMQRDPDLEISSERVMDGSGQSRKEFLLIDARNPEAFARVTIPGALNLPLYALRTKSFLENQRLVLFNEGYAYHALEQHCRRLRSEGFRASILDGGLMRWRASGGATDGYLPALKELHRVPAHRFFQEKDYDHWLVVDVSPKSRRRTLAWIPQGKFLPYTGNAKFFLKRFNHLIQRHPQRRPLQVLFVSQDGSDLEAIETIMEQAGIHSVFYLQGGLEAYQRYLQQQATLAWRGHRERSVQKCWSCP
jgi:rhodanese-related sulfurtransferase